MAKGVLCTFAKQKERKKKLCYADILRKLSDKTGSVEASFSSKLLAVCNTDMPIWDSVVISRLGISPSYSTKRETKIGQTIAKYEEIVSWYKHVLATKEADKYLARFDREFPNFKFSKVKKLDFLIWASGKK